MYSYLCIQFNQHMIINNKGGIGHKGNVKKMPKLQ